jgi:hypothetical protein
MTQQQTILELFAGIEDLRITLTAADVSERTGVPLGNAGTLCSKLASKGELVRTGRGNYRRASQAEQLAHKARASLASAPGEGPQPEPRPRRQLSSVDAIRAEERERLLEHVREARATAECREAKDWIAGFEAGVAHVTEAILGKAPSSRVRRTG